MKETLKEIHIAELPKTQEEFQSLLLEQIATPWGSAAMFIAALNIYVQNPDLGQACLDMVRLGEPISPAELNNVFQPFARQSPFVARSYIAGATPENGYTIPEGDWVIYIKITDEKTLRRKSKTVYVGCSGTGSYRPITLASKPPRFVRKRFGVKIDYEDDPWFVTDYPSILLPVPQAASL
ncbi:MAG: hypothetical protein IKU26_03270 [Clostridia bacterium]|nr:hypothetical protein [Clostridia bacterium]